MRKTNWLAAFGVAGALCAASSSASAQTINYGNDCPGFSGITPTLSASGQVVSGQGYTLSVTGPASTGAVFFAGISNSSWMSIPLPLDVTPFGFTGCDLNVSLNVQQGFGLDGTGNYSVPVTGHTAGVSIYLQVLTIDPDLVNFTTLGGLSEGLEVTPLVPSSTAVGDVIVTEVMQNPAFVSDAAGEWFEVYNTTASDINIENWIVMDNDTDFTILINGGAGITVPAGGYAVLGNNDDSSSNGNVQVDYEYAQNGQLFLSNSADELVLIDPAATVTEIDRIEYDGGTVWPDPTGKSMSLDASKLTATDNDSGANWADATCTIAGGPPCNDDLGTPGYANDQCTTTPCGLVGSGELLITEIMQNPGAVSDNDGEWLEVYNTTGSAIDMNGYTLVFGNTEVIASSVVVPAGGYAILADTADPSLNGNLPTIDYEWGGLFLSNTSSTLQILDGSSNLIVAVQYDDGATFPDPNGASMTLNPTKFNVTDAASGSNWCEATSTYGDGDAGTPGAANDTCP